MQMGSFQESHFLMRKQMRFDQAPILETLQEMWFKEKMV